MNTITDTLITMADQGTSRAKMKGWLMFEHDMSDKEADKTLKGALGSASASTTDWVAIVDYMIENWDDSRSRREKAKEMAELGLCKESSAFHYWSMYNLIAEFRTR